MGVGGDWGGGVGWGELGLAGASCSEGSGRGQSPGRREGANLEVGGKWAGSILGYTL